MKMLLFRRALGAFLVLATLPGFAQFEPTKPLPIDPNVKMGKLPNGLTYYIRKNAKPEKKVELRLAVNTGSVLENEDQRGLAHFMEHMNFNGSKNFPKNKLVDYLQKVGVEFGADLNAYTSFDETVYILPIASDDAKILEQGFLVLEDWAFNNLLDKSEIEKERGVVLEESRLNKNADMRLVRQYFPRLMNGSKYGERLPIGSDSVLKTFSPATLERFYRNWYRPNLMAVIVVGDINPAQIEQKIKAHFGKFQNPAKAPARPARIPITERRGAEAMVLTDAEASSTSLQLYSAPRPATEVKTWGDYRKAIIRQIVNSLINQRLEELTKKENPPFVYAFAGNQEFIRGYESFASYAEIGNGNPKDAVNALVQEIERARAFGFLDSEIARLKASMLNEAEEGVKEQGKSPSGFLVSQYLQHYLNGRPVIGEVNRYNFLKQVLPRITTEEVNALVKQLPAADRSFALLTAPEEMKSKLPNEGALLNDLVAATKLPVKPYEEKAVAASLMDQAPEAGKVVQESKNEKVGTTDLKLSNGVVVTIKSTTLKNDEIVMDAMRLGGWTRFPLADKDNAKMAAELVTEMGVGEMSPTDLKKFLSGKTVEARPYLNDYEDGIQGSSSVKDFEAMLQLVHLYFTRPRADQALLNSYVTKNKAQIAFLKGNPQFFFADTVQKVLYNNNPWVDMIPKEENYNNLKLEKAMDIYKQVFGNADGMHFTFVGNIDAATARPLIEKYLGSLPAAPAEHKFKDNGARPIDGLVNMNVKKGKEQQSMIVIQWETEAPYSRENKMALRALTDMLNIRVTEKLREEMSGIYGGGFNGVTEKRPYTHYNVVAYVPCGPDNVDKLTTALLGLVKDAQEGKLTQGDLDKVKETWRKEYQTQKQNNNYWLSVLSQSFIDGLDPAMALDYEQRINKLTLKDVQEAAKQFVPLNRYFKAVLYPENANVEAGVKKQF